MTAHSEQRMRVQHDVEVQIAIAAAIQSLAALARQAQPLPICCALGNACLYLMRHAMQEPVLVVFGYGKVKLDFSAVVRVLERNMHLHFEVLPGHGDLTVGGAAGALSPAAKLSKQVGQVNIIEGKLACAKFLLPIGRRLKILSGSMAA